MVGKLKNFEHRTLKFNHSVLGVSVVNLAFQLTTTSNPIARPGAPFQIGASG